ncbi:hypothetical protein Agub_g13161, partial [Astrephomene gubernaculifera]
MARPGSRLPPVEDGEGTLGVLKGQQMVAVPSNSGQSKSISSIDQFTALFGYSPTDRRPPPGRGPATPPPTSLAKDEKAGATVSPPRAGSPPRANILGMGPEEMQHALGYRPKRKGEHDLRPAQQRAFQFRGAINKSTLCLQPDLSPESIMDSAASYALPPSTAPPALTPALLDGLKPGPPPATTDASLMGTFILQKDLKPFSSSTRLPYQHLNGSAPGASVEAPPQGPFMMPPVDVSMSDAYNYNVPADVRTGEDAVRLFSSSAAKGGLIIYCNLNPQAGGGEYNPYDLVVVDRARVDPRHHYVLTQSGVTQMLGGTAQELQPFHAWQRDRNLFTVLRKLVFFKHNEVFQAFWQWRDAVRVLKFRARQRLLAHQLLVLSPTFHRALLNVRRMTLAVSSDTNGTWRKTPDGQWVELEAELVAPGPVPSRHQQQQQQQQPLPTPPPQLQLQHVNESSSVSGSGAAGDAVAAAAAAGGSGAAGAASQDASGVTAEGGGLILAISGPEFAPPTPLPAERLPESGLPYQLGYVGTVHDQYSLADFKRMREEQRSAVSSALQDMVGYVRSQVQVVGQAVQAKLAAAQAAVAKPTRQEARQQRFEAPGRQAWKAKSLALAHSDADQRQRDLEDAVHAAHQLLRFVTLADCLMLGQLAELARLAVLLCVCQLEMPRKGGLYIVAGSLEDPTATSAAAVSRSAGLPAWGRSGTFASSVVFAASSTMGRRRSAGFPLLAASSRQSHAGDAITPRAPRNFSGNQSGSDDDEDESSDDIPTPAPAFVFNPGSEDLSSAVANLPREILHVVIVSSAALTTYPDVRQLLSEIGAKGIPVPARVMNARTYDMMGSSTRVAGGFHGEVLRSAVDVRAMMNRLHAAVLADYSAAMQHPAMQPYRGHEVQWGRVSRFAPESYRNTGMSPETLHADLSSTSAWLGEMVGARTSVIVGLVALDMSALQRAALPAIQKAHSGIMSLLGALLVAQSQQLTRRLADYTANLISRPSQLPEFVAYVEIIWPHLDPLSSIRQAITAELGHMTHLHVTYLESSPNAGANPGSPTLYHPLYGMSSSLGADGGHHPDDDDEDADPNKPPSGRQVRGAWEALQASMARYTDEARAAADYFQNAAALMVTHLKTSLIESGNALHLVLSQLRTGVSTDPSAAAPDVAAHLDGLAEGLRTLAAGVEQHSSWARLLTHPSTTGLVASLEAQLGAARSVLAARRALWDVVAGWRRFLDRLYGVPCIDEDRQRLMAELADHVTRLRTHAARITSLHTDDDLTSTRTVTPAEQKLGAHLSVLVKSWQDILPLAQQLVNPAVKPRHLRTLLGWLAAHRAVASAAAAAAGKGGGGGGGRNVTPMEAAGAAPPVLLMQDPFALPPTHVRQDDALVAEAAGRTSLAQLVTSCSESAHTRQLVARISQVALGEAQLVSWLQSIKERLTAIPLTYSSARTWGSFTPTNVPEVLAALAALGAELGAVQRSPFYCGVLREYERVEQLLGGLQRSMQDVSYCMDKWTYMCQLLHNPVVSERVPEAVASMDMLGSAWRKLHMAAMEQPTLHAASVALQDCRVLVAAMENVRRGIAQALLPAMRDAYPRLWLVGDEVLMAALAVGGEVEALPGGLLEALYGGVVGLQVQVHEHLEDSPPLPPEVVALVGSSGEVCTLRQPLAAPSAAGSFRLEGWLSALESELRASLAAHTCDCVAACGYLSPEVWVASFPSQCVMLVDAVVWTATVTSTLERTSQGDRSALRNLLDQSVLRLETMARQLRAAMVAVPQGLMRGGRQVEDLAARAAAAALTA